MLDPATTKNHRRVLVTPAPSNDPSGGLEKEKTGDKLDQTPNGDAEGRREQTHRNGGKSRSKSMTVMVLNWTGFIICVLTSTFYPIVAFIDFVGDQSPRLPYPPKDNLTHSYYAEDY